MTQTQQKAPSEIAVVRHQLEQMQQEFAAALPAQIPSERFARTVLTAVQLNPDLLSADRRSLLAATMKAAQDGLMPDGREGALVIFRTKVKVVIDGREREVYKQLVQWMPMVAGLMKRARNSGLIASLTAEVVHEKDDFRRTAGDTPSIVHVPYDDEEDAGPIRGAYAIAVLKDGQIIRQWMAAAAIERVRSKSRAKDSLMWVDFKEEGYKKTVIRRLCKYLPSSADNTGMEAFLTAASRDDETFDLSERTARSRRPVVVATAEEPEAPRGRRTAEAPDMDRWADEQERHGQATGQQQAAEAGDDEAAGSDPDGGQEEDQAEDVPTVTLTMTAGMGKDVPVAEALARLRASVEAGPAGWAEELIKLNPWLEPSERDDLRAFGPPPADEGEPAGGELPLDHNAKRNRRGGR